jgi:hypothetical protein
VDGVVATPDSPDLDPRPTLAKAVVEAGFGLIELRPLAVNLEEIFLEITRNDNVRPALSMIDDMNSSQIEEMS